MISSFFLLLMLVSSVNGDLGQNATAVQNNASNNQSCERFGNITAKAHVGWPFEVRCNKVALVSELKARIRGKVNITCTIKTANGTVLFITSFESFGKLDGSREYPRINVTDPVNSTYFVEMKVPHENFCGVVDFIVAGEIYEEKYNCSTPLSLGYDREELRLGQISRYIHCGVARSAPVPLYGKESEYTYEWWYNCSKTLPSNVVVSKKYRKSLRISNATFSTGGEYVCAVRYGNQLRFVFLYKVCVQRPILARLSMKCPKRVGVNEGSDVNLTCFVDAGLGRIGFFSPIIRWFNDTKSPSYGPICGGRMLYYTKESSFIDNNEIKCTRSQVVHAQNLYPLVRVWVGMLGFAHLYTVQLYSHKSATIGNFPYNLTGLILQSVQPKQSTFIPQRKTCFQYQPPPELDIIYNVEYNITLQIKNLRRWDLGNYTIWHDYGSMRELRVIEVYLDKTKDLMNSSMKAAIGVGISVLLILMLLLCYWGRLDILWCNKKYFGSYERERKTHDVVLIYHYSRDDMKPSSKFLTECLVENIQLFLKEKTMTFYDENKEDGDSQFRVQNITKILDDCHRILIILNDEIAFDEWNLHKVYTAIKNSAYDGTNVIFISLPGLKSRFRNAPNESQIALKHAMKIGTTIEWSGKVPFESGFKRRLEYALPKKQQNRQEHQPSSPARALVHTAV